jgi:hypothetical protein
VLEFANKIADGEDVADRYLCLNEVELGAPLRPPMSSIFRQKVSPQCYRSLVLEAKRFKVPFTILNLLLPLPCPYPFPLSLQPIC